MDNSRFLLHYFKLNFQMTNYCLYLNYVIELDIETEHETLVDLNRNKLTEAE
jgi:hypothetical protein